MLILATERLDWLKHQMARGWHVKAPVIERASLYRSAQDSNAYEFILCHDGGCQVVAVPDCPELHEFMAQQSLMVVSR